MNTGRAGKCGDTGRGCGKAELEVPKELVISKLFEHKIRILDSEKVEQTEQNQLWRKESSEATKKITNKKPHPLPRGQIHLL